MKVGVIGCGFQGTLHVEMLQALDDVEVVAVVDLNSERAHEVADRYGVRFVYTDYLRMLGEQEPDLVSVCTMPVHHAEMTIAAFAHGCHVICEKPLAMDAIEGEAMVRSAVEAERMLAVGFNMRFTPNALAIKAFIDNGGFGRPVYTRAWAKASQIPWWGEHYRREISGGGALAATAVHFLDLALYFAGFPTPTTVTATSTQLFPRKRGGTSPHPEVTARYSSEDLFSAHIRFKGGFWLTLEGSWVDNRPSTNGSPSWDYSLDAIGEVAQVSFDPLQIRGEDRAGEIIDLLPPGTSSDVSFPPSVNALLKDAVEAARSGREPVVPGHQALVVQKIVDAIYASAENGHEIALSSPGAVANEQR